MTPDQFRRRTAMTGGFSDFISGYPKEGKTVGDLAQAIVALGRAAEKRRMARGDLAEATDTIAKAIRDELRAGDKVTVEADAEDNSTTYNVIYRAATVQYRETPDIQCKRAAVLLHHRRFLEPYLRRDRRPASE